jgi:hypothetical protein
MLDVLQGLEANDAIKGSVCEWDRLGPSTNMAQAGIGEKALPGREGIRGQVDSYHCTASRPSQKLRPISRSTSQIKDATPQTVGSRETVASYMLVCNMRWTMPGEDTLERS